MELSIEDTLNNGIEAHKAGHIQKAETYYTSILSSNPRHPDANHNKGVLLANTGRLQEALPFFKNALEANLGVVQFWRSYIETLAKLNRIIEATEVLEQAKKLGAKGEGLLELEKLIEHQALMLTKKPFVEHEHLSVLKPTKVSQALRLAKRKEKDGSFGEAQNIYQDILNKFPKNKIATKRLHDLSKKTISKPEIRQDPPASVIKSLTNLNDQNKYQELVSEATKLTSSYPQSIALYDFIGTANFGLGIYQKSVDAYKQALAMSPNSPVLHYNLGNSLKEQGNLKDAIISYEKALSVNTNSVGVFLNMARAFQDHGSHKNAVKAYQRAISINPNLAEAFNNMGVSLENLGELGMAIDAYNNAMLKNPNCVDANYNLANLLKNGQFQEANPNLQNTIKSILDKKTVVRPSDISDAVLSLLKFEPAVKELLYQNSQQNLRNTFDKIISDLSDLPLLLKLMSICPLADLDIELGFSNIRSLILESVLEESNSTNILKFQSALALHCFTNEYIYDQTSRDLEFLQKLETRVELDLSKGKQQNPQDILCLASYKSLSEYDWCHSVVVTTDLEEVFTRQVLEPKKEENLKKEIKTLDKIADGVSSKVKEQYEKNPYPRWVNLGLIKKPTSIHEMVTRHKLKISTPDVKKTQEPLILIAGCGTGQHSIGTAARYKNSKVIAIDLSKSSLAYAKRKTKELGIKNIEYIQADLLDVEKLNTKFDIIESMGVLHHMDDPMAGWQALTECLKSGGLMKIGLYSKIARKPISDIRKNIATSKRQLSDEEILLVRKKIILSTKPEHELIKNFRDFYSLSEIRDLLFHVKEHSFTLPQIKVCLNNLGLKFCGFQSQKIQNAFLKVNNKRNLYDLEKWDDFEKSQPAVFAGMYQFWCQQN